MTELEVHRTLKGVKLLERLSLNLEITDRQYQSTHELNGELRAFVKPDTRVVRDRESPPTGLATLIARTLGGESVHDSYPSTRFFVGLAHAPELVQDEESHREDTHVTNVSVNGVPDNDTVEFGVDWTAEEAKRAVREGETSVGTHEYDIEGLPRERLPLLVRANLYRDAVTLAEKLGLVEDSTDRHGGRPDQRLKGLATRSVQELEGLAGLAIEVELRDSAGTDQTLTIDKLELGLSRTFPQIDYAPFDDATYDPEAKQIRWSKGTVSNDSPRSFIVFGPIDQLLDIDSVTAKMQGTLSGGTMSGLRVTSVYDESGSELPQTSNMSDPEHIVTVDLDVEVDPAALSGEAQEVSEARVTMKMTPEELYQKLRAICTRNGIHIRDSDGVGEAEPVPGRDGVFKIDGADADEDGIGSPGMLKVKKEFGNRGVVYADLTVTGEFVAISEESQVSAFDDSEDRLVRSDMGGLDTRGRSQVRVKARSASSELNSEFVGILENELGGDN